MTSWQDFDKQLDEISECVNHTTRAQLRHRMAMVEMWAPQAGDSILDVGCGQGGSTEVLAAAVGDTGKVLGVDTASLDYGAPIKVRDAHAFVKDSPLGSRIEFRMSTDLLSPEVDFAEEAFDLAVFALSSWHMSSPDVLSQLFARVRPWAKRLGYAEWSLRPRTVNQVPHLIAPCCKCTSAPCGQGHQVEISTHWCSLSRRGRWRRPQVGRFFGRTRPTSQPA